jgi:DNA-binding CsgD family transcriptional regulator
MAERAGGAALDARRRKAFDGLVSEGQAALARGDGAAACRAFEAALGIRESAASWEGLGRVRYLALDYAGAIAAHERAFVAWKREGDRLGVARVARTVAWLHLNVSGDWAVAHGWLARARSVLLEAPDNTSERGWAELFGAMYSSDHRTRERGFRAAIEIGRRAGEVSLEVDALAWLGVELVSTDRIDQGMALLDEALTAICSGEIDDIYVNEGAFCGMLFACERTHDVTRAEQWVRAGDEFARRRHLAAIGAYCRSYLGGILTMAGRWAEAEAALLESNRFFEHGYADRRAHGLIRLGDLRVRQGRLEEATQLLAGLDHHADAVRPLASLLLAMGETARARDLLEQTAGQVDLEAAVGVPVLALLVDVLLAEGSVSEAAIQADRLKALADEQSQGALRATASLAQARVMLVTGTGDARGLLLEARAGFARAQMPFEEARARMELARAVMTKLPDAALAEAEAALEAFERLEATQHADAAAALVRALGGRARTGPKRRAPLTRRESEVLTLLGHGLSNPEIAERLFITRKTAEHHVGQVLGKLSLRNRAEAAAYAARLTDEQIGEAHQGPA